ncbi:MAG: macro domain-containing protein [Armatimonadetes bacterium]|nr:macro domain-containing protein [Armatimonadota bacterium]
MIRYKQGNLLLDDSEALVNSVNCVGVMGRGVALQFKEAFPENFKAYAAACNRGDVQPGRMFVFETGGLTNPRYIINFPTKRHWRGKSRIEDVEAGLDALVAEIRSRGIKSIALPPLGSGLGGLNWGLVRARIQAALDTVPDVDVVVFEPRSEPEDQHTAKPGRPPEMTAGRATLVALMERYLAGLMDTSVSLLEVHKLLYFMQEASQPLRLRFVPGPYGPYAENLRHVLRAVDGYFVDGFVHGDEAPNTELRLVPGAVSDAMETLRDDEETKAKFDRVADLVEGFETPFGLELLATVHWVATRNSAQDLGLVVSRTYAWDDRKRKFSEKQIELAFDVLGKKGWLQPGSAKLSVS